MSPLPKRVVPVSFSEGMETKTDAKQVNLGRLLALENASFISPKKLTKRNGVAYLTQFSASANGIGAALMAYEQGLLLADGSYLYGFDQSNASWQTLGPLESTGALTQNKIVLDSTYSIGGYDATLHPSGLELGVYERGAGATGGTYFVGIDTLTGTMVIPPTIIPGTTPCCPKVIVSGNNFVVFYVDTNVLYGFTVNVTTLSVSASSAMTPASGSTALATGARQQFDVCPTLITDANPGVYIVYNHLAIDGSYTIIFTLASAPLSITATASAATPSNALCVFCDQTNFGPVVGYTGGTSEVLFKAHAAYTLGVIGSGVLATGTPNYARNITGISTSAAAIAYTFAWTYSDGANWQNDSVLNNTVGAAYAVGSSATVALGVSLSGKAFQVPIDFSGDTRVLLPVAFDNSPSYAAGVSNIQSTFFLLDTAGNQVARYSAQEAGGHYANTSSATYSMLPESTNPVISGSTAPSSIWLLPAAQAYQISLVAGAAVLQTGLFGFIYNPAPGYIPRAQLAGIMHLGGSSIFETDASGVPVEHFFAYNPWVISAASSTFGGMTAGDRYQVLTTYEWTDANGQTQVSAPGIAFPLVAGNNSITITGVGIVAGNQVTVSGTSYVGVVATVPTSTQFLIGGNDATTMANLAAALSGIGGIVVASVVGNVITLVSAGSTLSVSSTASGITLGSLGGAQLSFTLTIPTLRVTAKTGARGAVRIGIYRTQGNGTTFYLDGYITNSTAVNSLTYVAGTQTDAVLGAKAPLYTQPNANGTVLENDTPPPTQAMVTHRNRIFLVDSTDPLSIWYSKPVIHTPGTPSNNPVQFSAFQILIASEQGGGVTALGTIDDKLIVFKQDRIFYVSGQGPAANGTSNDFSDTIRVTVDCGAISQASIVTTPDGLMFQSLKGIYLLDRMLQVQYIGAPVEAYNSQTVTSAQLISNTNQVRFTMSGGNILVYDYLMRQWSVSIYTWLSSFGSYAADSCIWQKQHAFMTSQGFVYVETPGVYEDQTYLSTTVLNYIAIRALSSWISLAELQGYQRVYRFLVLGSAYNACTMTVSLGYNFQALSQVNAIAVAGTESPLQWRIRTDEQKCESIQIQIADSKAAGKGVGQGIDLSGFALEIGVKYGAFKLPAAQSTG